MFRDTEAPPPVEEDVAGLCEHRRVAQPETAGGCSYPGGCECTSFLGYGDLCGNCSHNSSFHW